MAIFEKYYKRISIWKGVGEREWDWGEIVSAAKWGRHGLGFAANGLVRNIFDSF